MCVRACVCVCEWTASFVEGWVMNESTRDAHMKCVHLVYQSVRVPVTGLALTSTVTIAVTSLFI